MVRFPEDSNVTNVKTYYGAVGDGKTDDTKAIQSALQDKNRLVYLPNGVYLVCETLAWGKPYKRKVLQGESQSHTIIRLKDNCPNFANPSRPKPIITTFEAEKTGQAFRNSIYDLTVETGSGNPGAIGIEFLNNNQGGIRNVTIKSGDPNRSGAIGLALTKSWPGPSMIRNLHIIGFDYGIQVRHPEYSIVFENLLLEKQRLVGISNRANILSIRHLISKNDVPVIKNIDDRGLITIIDSNFSGGSPSNHAIENQKGGLYVRNVTASGYKSIARNAANIIPGDRIVEYNSHQSYTLFSSPQRSLQLLAKDVPTVQYGNLSDWASVTHFGANGFDDQDDTSAIQKAVNSGKSIIYFPVGNYIISNTIRVGGLVKLITGLESTLRIVPPLRNQTNPVFKFVTGNSDSITLERFWGDYGRGAFHWIEHASSKTLFLRNIAVGSGKAYRNSGFGQLFVEDVTAGDWTLNRQQVWMRQINPENFGTKIINQGGTLWILGLKTEKSGTVVSTSGAGKTEVLGGLLYPGSSKIPENQPAFLNDESQLSIIIGESNYGGGSYTTIVQEIRAGIIKRLMRNQLPQRGRGIIVPLYVGF